MSNEPSLTILKKTGLGIAVVTALAGCVVDSTPGTPDGSSSSDSSAPPTTTSSSSTAVSSSSAASSAPSTDDLALVVAVNAGGSALSMDGTDYIADKYFQGGSRNDTTDSIGGAANSALYQSERYGSYKYEVPLVGDGTYTFTVKLHFAEIYQTSAGERQFSVAIEGNTVLNNIDLYSLAGHDGAYDYIAEDIQVSDGNVTIELIEGVENPTIAGFALYSNNAELDTSEPEIPDNGGIQFVGNITTNGQVRDDFMRYWDQITPENEGKWGTVERTRDSYNWGPLDRIYDFARQNNIPVKAHTLVWGSQQPGWIGGLSASEQAAEVEEWIRDYCTRYPDTPMIDVVNEADPGHAPAEYARNAFGNNWITKSFELARQYCPRSILIYNDYNFLTWQKDNIINMIRPSIQAGVVDAVGTQAHSIHDTVNKVWSPAEIRESLDQISALGVPIYVSEYDIEATNDQQQLEWMQGMFPVFYEHPNVVGITLWGYVVGSTWRQGTGLIQPSGQHRPSMDWLMNYLGRN